MASPIDLSLLVALADKYFEIFSKILNKISLEIGTTGLSIKVQTTSSIDERIAKIDEAKTSLLEGVRLIDELRKAAEDNKKDAELALLQINKLEIDKASIQKELDAIRKIAQTDVETFRKMAGVPSATDIRRERMIGFVGGVVSSLIASGVIWVGAWVFGYFFSNGERRIVAYLDTFLLSWDLRQARLASLRELQSQTEEELDALMPSVLDRAFKGEL